MQDLHETDWGGGGGGGGKMLWQNDLSNPKGINISANFHKTAQCPGSPIRMIWESFPRSTLVPHVWLTSFDLEFCKMDALAMRSLFT